MAVLAVRESEKLFGVACYGASEKTNDGWLIAIEYSSFGSKRCAIHRPSAVGAVGNDRQAEAAIQIEPAMFPRTNFIVARPEARCFRRVMASFPEPTRRAALILRA